MGSDHKVRLDATHLDDGRLVIEVATSAGAASIYLSAREARRLINSLERCEDVKIIAGENA